MRVSSGMIPTMAREEGREHAVWDDLSNHEDGDELPREGFVFDLWNGECKCCSWSLDADRNIS